MGRMARRRTRPKPPRPVPLTARGVLSWLLVLAMAGAVGWLWWRAAYGPGSWTRPGAGSLLSRGFEGADEPVEEPPGMDRDDLGPGLRPEQERPGRADLAGGVGTGGTGRVTTPAAPATPLAVGVTSPVPVVNLEPVGGVPPVPATALAATNPEPVDVRDVVEAVKREGNQVLAVQLALARRGLSSGSLDGVIGSQTRAALRVFQRQEGLPATGVIDELTLTRLGIGSTLFTNYVITSSDLQRLTWVPSTWLGKSSRERLDYETVLEMVAEKAHSHPKLLQRLNPGIRWGEVRPGTAVVVPAVAMPPLRGRAGFVRISLSEKALRVFDPASNLVAHFPCSIARKVEKRPVGELKVVRLAPDPNYRFDPEIFRESPEARKIGRKLMIPPGPNNPVGTAWIGLNRPGYGIHGTPNPEDVGRTESHGCFRLANWNAEFLVRAAWVGMPVHVEP